MPTEHRARRRLWRPPRILVAMAAVACGLLTPVAQAFRPAVDPLPPVRVELQPLASQVARLVEALDYIGMPLPAADREALASASALTDPAEAARRIQSVLDPHCLLDVLINPESRVTVAQGQVRPELVEHGWRTFLMKVRNEAGVTAELRVTSPNALPVHSRGPKGFSMDPRPAQTITAQDVSNRWLDLNLFEKPPVTKTLSGLELEYRIFQLYSRDAGKREATLRVDVGQGTQDIGFRNDAPILFTAAPSHDVTFRITDERGEPTVAALVVRDAQQRIYPSPAKRLAPDFAFHPQVYRVDGERMRLPAGRYTIDASHGPEYLASRHELVVASDTPASVTVPLKRWIDPAARSWYSGDHHIHAAGCRHYETPTEGVRPEDMVRHILGEALNIGAVLTWGPGYYHQKQFFEGRPHKLSRRDHLMRYDLEVSGFPSSHAGHLVLLRLQDQDYPGTKVLEDWPSWDLPILQWARAQGAVVGFAHSGWGLQIASTDLPSTEMPKFDGIGANEFIVDVTHDAVDFISTVDTPPAWELNIWYHVLNAGFRTRISGETDFPCIYGERVGLGRSYVKLDRLDYDAWAGGIRDGRAYVGDGHSHLIDFKVGDRLVGTEGSELRLAAPGTVRVTAGVAARLDPSADPEIRRRKPDEHPYWHIERARVGETREVPLEVIVNGRVAARRQIVADGTLRDIAIDVPIDRSSWVALRILPSSHTNPVFVLVGDRPIRPSRASVEWCLNAVDVCWQQKAPRIRETERDAAARAYDHARAVYKRILGETIQ